ncbi:MAG TPA: beta-ketoacyl-ACP synthase 3, partial [Chitinophagales bacterium]
MNAVINSIGTYVPNQKIDNSYFEKILDTNEEWIISRTGISTRYFAAENEFTSDLCIKAVENLVANYQKNIADVDFVIVASSTTDHVLPSVASKVQAHFGIKNAGCIDVSAACAGFVYGLILAKGLIAARTHKKVLVIGAETLSKFCDFTDRTTCILFGDGAGAVLVEASETNYIFQGITATDGTFGKDLYISHIPALIDGQPAIANGKVQQNGRAVFKWAITTLEEKINELASVNNVSLNEIDWLVPHSANIRILESVCEKLNYPAEKCLESIRNYGNTSAAS